MTSWTSTALQTPVVGTLPPAGRYRIDPGPTYLELVGLGARCRVPAVRGVVTVDEPVDQSHVTVAITDAVISFRTTRLGGAEARVLGGDLTIRGADDVDLDVTFIGSETAPTGEVSIVLAATATICRADWAHLCDALAPSHDRVLGPMIDLELLLHAVTRR